MQSSTHCGLIFINNFQWGLYAWFSQIPVFQGIVVAQKTHQSRNVHVVVVIEMAEPPETRKNIVSQWAKKIRFGRSLQDNREMMNSLHQQSFALKDHSVNRKNFR